MVRWLLSVDYRGILRSLAIIVGVVAYGFCVYSVLLVGANRGWW